MKQLIVNADDFGLTQGISEGILDGHRQGLITSATILVNMPAFAHAVACARTAPTLGVGLHLNLVDGRPVSTRPLPGLVTAEGFFFGRVGALLKQLYLGPLRRSTLEIEMRAQIEKGLEHLPGLTHLDGHKHLHIMPGILPCVLRLAQEYRIPCVRYPAESPGPWGRRPPGMPVARWVRPYLSSQLISLISLFGRRQFIYNTVVKPDYFFGLRYTGWLDREFLERLLRMLPEGVSELMCHPGYVRDELTGVRTRLRAQRERELSGLMHPEVLALARAQRVALINYRDLAQAAAFDTSRPSWGSRG